MRLITGDECGLLKECLPEKGEQKRVQRINGSETMGRKRGVIDLCWVESDQDECFAALSMDDTCSIWERTADESDSFLKYRKRSEIVDLFENQSIHPSSKPLGLFSASEDRLCTCNAGGRVSIIHTGGGKIINTFDTVKPTDQDDPKKPLLTACTLQNDENRIALGGQERDVTLWDIFSGKEVWKAKNARPDPQTLLQQQVWPTSIEFLESNILAVGSAHSEVRLYDIRQQRRPIALTPKGMWEHRVTAICQLPTNALVVGDSAGFLQSMDWRKNLNRVTGRFVGPAGSIRAVVAHPEQKRLAVVGLDRMLRIYDFSTRKQMYCMYLRQRLNCVLFGQKFGEESDLQDTATDAAEEGGLDQDDKIENYVDSDDEEPELEGEGDSQQDSEGDEGSKASGSETDSGSRSGSGSGSGDESSGDEEEKVSTKARKRARR